MEATTRLNPRLQGDIGEMAAMQYLAERGAHIYIPFGHSPDVDFVADLGDKLIRVQVKTCTVFRNNRWEVTICTRGGNQSWNGIVKRFGPERCDFLFALVGDGRQWFIPAGEIEGSTKIALGGPKYAQHEVERGAPIAPAKPTLAILR